jgi:hypothetical protein
MDEHAPRSRLAAAAYLAGPVVLFAAGGRRPASGPAGRRPAMTRCPGHTPTAITDGAVDDSIRHTLDVSLG